MAGRMVEFPSNGETATGYLSEPAGGPGPGVVVIQEWWGLIDQIKRTADRFAAEGFTALVPDLYHGRVIGLHEPDEAGKALMAMDEQRATREMCGAVDYLLSSGAARGEYVGVVGFCMGGGLAVALGAAHDRVRAVVSYYGVHMPETDLSQITGQVLGHFGEDDQMATSDAVRSLDEGLEAASVPHTFYSYPGAGHAFANEDRPEVFHAESERLAWERTLDFLRAQLAA